MPADTTQRVPGPERIGSDSVAGTIRLPATPGEADASPPSPRQEAPPSALGRYHLADRLGGGGMGEVYVARDPELERDVAIKVSLDSGSSAYAAKFLREARITGQLEHPGVVPVHDVGRTAAGEPFFAMRRVGGRTLETVLERAHGPGLPALLSIFAKVCDTVGFAHSRGVIHRDLKPANIMTGEFGEVYVMDWGLAKRRLAPGEEPGPDDSRLGPSRAMQAAETMDGTVMGTPHYMPPEQAEGRTRAIDERSDVYALGAILYRILCGSPPHEGHNAIDVLEKISGEDPLPPSKKAGTRDVPWELEAVAMKALAREPAQRYPSVLALKDDVESYRAGLRVGAARYTLVGRVLKWIGRHPVLVRSAAALAISLGAWWGWGELVRRSAVDRAWAVVRATDPELRLADAHAVAEGADPDAPPRLGAGELSRQAALIAGLQRSSAALAELLRVSPHDSVARRTQYAVLCEMGRLAALRGEDAMAELAYSSAAGLGLADEQARTQAERAAGAAARRLARRLARIHARIDEAHAGTLTGERAFMEAVVELASYADRQTVEAMVAVLDDATARLRACLEAELVAVTAPDDLEVVRAAIAAWVDPFGPTPGTEQLDPFRNALTRLAPNALDSLSVGMSVMADRQLGALRDGGLDRARACELACLVLGMLADPNGSVEALVRLIYVDVHEGRAAHAGLALVALARDSRAADDAVMRVLGYERGYGDHFAMHGTFSTQVRRALAEFKAVPLPTEQEPQTVAAWIDRGQRKAVRGELDDAIHAYTKALELEPQSTLALLYRGEVRRKKGDLAGAMADDQRVIALDPRNAAAYLQRALIYADSGNVPPALEDFARAIALDPNRGDAYNNRANVLLKMGDVAGALADYDRAIALDPRNPALYSNRGNVKKLQGDRAGALVDLDRAIELDPRNAASITNRGNFHFNGGAFDLARADFERAIALDPKAWQPRGALGWALAQLNQLEAGIASMKKAIELAPAGARPQLERMLKDLEARR